MTIPNQSNIQHVGPGRGGYIGYEYQVDVSVWITLHLVVERRTVQLVQIEPLSNEDLEAEVSAEVSEDDIPGRLTNVSRHDEYTLVVQAKFRTGHMWTDAKLRNLLTHGGKKRKSAVERLNDRSVRYLLVTNAGLDKNTMSLSVSHPASDWPKHPTSLTSQFDDSDLTGRVAILGDLDEEKLSFKIKDTLIESFRVPHGKWKTCREELREAVRLRMKGVNQGDWTREEIEDIVRSYDGYFASSPQLETFVPPSNWDQIRATFEDRHAVVIVGSTGTGKSLVTRKLIESLRNKIPGMEIVSVRDDPRQLHNDITEPPVIYEIEDPWGRLVFETQRLNWNHPTTVIS